MSNVLMGRAPTAPSAKAIFEFFLGTRWSVSIEDARLIRRLMKGQKDPRSLFEKDGVKFSHLREHFRQHGCLDRDDRPYARHFWRDAVMIAIDTIIDTIIDSCGVESVVGVDEEGDQTGAFEYTNTGDTYSPAIVYVYHKARFYLTCWGDMVEALERRGWKFP